MEHKVNTTAKCNHNELATADGSLDVLFWENSLLLSLYPHVHYSVTAV